MKRMEIDKRDSDKLAPQPFWCYRLENFVNNGDSVEFIAIADRLNVERFARDTAR